MTLRQWLIALLIASTWSWSLAQDTPGPQEPSANESLEPAVDTSALPEETEDSPRASTADPVAPSSRPSAPARSGASGSRPGKALDRLELDATQITGNRELPKVLYIVPWKRSDLGDLLGKPVNSLLDEVLEPVDRDVFKRENRYYGALQTETAVAAPNSAPPLAPVPRE